MRLHKLVLVLALMASIFSAALKAQPSPDWTTPFPPFHIAGNLYYVGSADLASYLVTTPKGLILINSNLASSPPLIRKSVEALGFKWSNIKILLISHAHYDHCAGSDEIVKETGAKYEVMDADVAAVESGGRTDFHYGSDPTMHFAPAHVNRVLHNADTVSLGGVELTAHLTAGHTRGTTTWTMDEREGARPLHVVIVGSPNVNPGYNLVGNKTYPQIADDYRRGFAILNSLPCDIFLGAHGSYFDMKEKYARLKDGDKNALIDPTGYRAYIADRQQAFEEELAQQVGR